MSIFLWMPLLVLGQANLPTRAELEKRKIKLQREIEQATHDLNATKKNKRVTYAQLQILRNKIALRNQLIDNTNQEIGYINSDIQTAYRDIRADQKDLDTLKVQYAKMVVYAYKNRSAYDFLNYIFSAKSFNEAIKRFEYLKQYRQFRLHQAASILQTQELLKMKIANMNAQRRTRATILSSQEVQRKSLVQERQEKDQVIHQLQGHEKELMASIRQKKRAQENLNRTISILIRREIEAARKKALAEASRTKALTLAREKARLALTKTTASSRPSKSEPTSVTPTGSTSGSTRSVNILESTPEALALSEGFENNRGKLPWPVATGEITDPYGIHRNAVFSHITQQNTGIDIQTVPDGPVRAVFKGEVINVYHIEYLNWVVLIRHGQYFTVYSNLLNPRVKKGDEVSTDQIIGNVATNEQTGASKVHFEIYKGDAPVNPELWLKSRY
ncbi:MAG: murein hydrolase activator EnvC family protein [Chitinophagaceae bacterium]